MEEVQTPAPSFVEPQPTVWSRKDELFSPDLTLGYFALKEDGKSAIATHSLTHDSIDPARHDELTHTISVANWQRSQEMKRALTVMTSYTGEKEYTLGRYLNGLVPQHILDSLLKHTTPEGDEISWKQWLEHEATDEEFLQILYHHAEVMTVHATNERVLSGIDATQAKFLEGISWLQDLHHITANVRNLSDVSVRYGDIFDTYLQERSGYFDHYQSRIVLGQGHRTWRNVFVAEATRELPRVLTHELVHGLLGTALYDAASPLSHRWINEALTEVISRQIRKQNSEEVIEDNVYIEERWLLGKLIEPFRDQGFIGGMLARAYTGTSDDRKELVELFDKAYKTTGAIDGINMAIQNEQNRLANGSPIDRRIEELAVIKVRTLLVQNPQLITTYVPDFVPDETRAAAQDPK